VVTTSEEVYDEELEAIKRRRLLEYQRLLERMRREEEQRRIYEMKKEAVLRHILTPEARQRLTNLKLVRPELVEQLEEQLIQLASTGRIQTPISDSVLKEILKTVMARSRREIKLRGIRFGV